LIIRASPGTGSMPLRRRKAHARKRCSVMQYDQFFGHEFTIEYPTGSGQYLALRDIAGDLADR
jgi:hypothetical protein